MADPMSYLIPGTLAITLLGALATYLASDRGSRQVALVMSAPALAATSVILYSWNETNRPRLFYALILLMDATVLGVFTALDLFLFYVFWEFVLIPMYLLIAIWGGPNRKYASTKFFLYTGAASL